MHLSVATATPVATGSVNPGHDTPRFQLPVQGRVLVAHGGADVDGNHHVNPSVPNQRHAYDLLGVDERGNMFVDDGDLPQEWFGWGMPIVASAAGEVIGAIDGQRDLGISERLPAPDHPYGNRVAIRHDDGSVTWYAHLQQGSVNGALLGTRIAAGTQLGVLGNSGNSSAPHLHVQRQVGGDGSLDPAATGVELAFAGAKLVGSFRADPVAGPVDWRPASSQPIQPRVVRRGEVIEPA